MVLIWISLFMHTVGETAICTFFNQQNRASLRWLVCSSIVVLSTFDRSPPNITWYWTQHHRKEAKAAFKQWSYKTHPISRPYGRALGRLFWVCWRKDTATYRKGYIMWFNGHGTIYPFKGKERSNFQDGNISVLYGPSCETSAKVGSYAWRVHHTRLMLRCRIYHKQMMHFIWHHFNVFQHLDGT